MTHKRRVHLFLHIVLILLVLILAIGCDSTIPSIHEIIHRMKGNESTLLLKLNAEHGDDFSAQFFVPEAWINFYKEQSGTRITLQRREQTKTVADTENQPHPVSKVFNLSITPPQTSAAGRLTLAVENQYTSGSGEPLKIYYWRPFGGTVDIKEAPDGFQTQHFSGMWMFINTSRERSIEQVSSRIGSSSHQLETTTCAYTYTSGQTMSQDFMVGDPGPQGGEKAPWEQWLIDQSKESWLTPPPTPEGYRYSGYTVVHNTVAVHTTQPDADLERRPNSDDIDMIYSSSTGANAVLDNDIVIGHQFIKIDD